MMSPRGLVGSGDREQLVKAWNVRQGGDLLMVTQFHLAFTHDMVDTYMHDNLKF